MKQVNQKAISAKIDGDTFEMLEAYCKRNNMKRNRLINLATSEYIANHWTD